jgi:hypothetical protein
MGTDTLLSKFAKTYQTCVGDKETPETALISDGKR